MAAGDTMQGTRLERVSDLWGDSATDGGFCPVTRDGKRVWMVRTPNGHVGDLSAHEVTEEADGSITVSPSILVSDHTGDLWHGYLERGVWRQV